MNIDILQLDEQGLPKGTQSTMVNGEWVATVPSVLAPEEMFQQEDGGFTNFDVFSNRPIEVEKHVTSFEQVEVCGHLWTYKFVSTQPFVVTQHDPFWGIEYRISSLHGGKEMPNVKTPKFIRGPRKYRWTRLIDLARTLGEDPKRIWDGYCWLVSNRYLGHGGFDDRCVEVVYRTLDRQVFELPFYSCGWAGQVPKIKPNKLQLLWVPAGWAMSVCYLHALGFHPWESLYTSDCVQIK